MSKQHLWQKKSAAEDWVTRFTVGEDVRWDTLLLPYDIEATRAHVSGLSQIGVVSSEELASVEMALNELAESEVEIRVEDEDCHTIIENFLTEKLGDVGKKVHTGRSRNDQVLAALRLFLRDALKSISGRAAGVVRHLCGWGELHDRMLMPGYTHMQRAMPSTVGLWAMGYAELLVSDIARIHGAARRTNLSPLGSAAGYGVPYLDLPRDAVARRLGFDDVQHHVTAVQLSRGKFELDVVHAVAQLAGTFNRLASDLVLFNTSEYGFVRLPPEYCTGSSIMPQKQNPDVLELVRASYHRITAEMQVLMQLPANLSSGYHRDLQLTKEAVMRSVITCSDVTEAVASVLKGVEWVEQRLQEATSSELWATARALELVSNGIPFREAYRRAADDLDNLDAPSRDEALTAYRVDGYPGRSRPDLILLRLDQTGDF